MTITMATMVPTKEASTGGGKEQGRGIVIGIELHSTEHPFYRQLLPQLQLQKPFTTPPSPFSLPPISFLVKMTFQNTILIILIHLYLSLNSLTMAMTQYPLRMIMAVIPLTSSSFVLQQRMN